MIYVSRPKKGSKNASCMVPCEYVVQVARLLWYVSFFGMKKEIAAMIRPKVDVERR